ncbi:MAG: hypothetical protein QW171_03180 [Candidatus Bilamarchaeaceae archaeon]
MPGPTEVIRALLLQWYGIATIGLSIATALAAIVYMLGAALLNDKMKGWAKMELVEVFYSALIVAMAFTLIQVIDNIVIIALDVTDPTSTTTYMAVKTPIYEERLVNICDPNEFIGEEYENVTACHMRLGIYYLNTVFREGADLTLTILINYAWTSVAGETALTVQTMFEKSGFVMWSPWKGFFIIRNIILENTATWNLTVVFLAKMQEILLRFIAISGFPIIFVSGVVLRTFTFTRKLGGLLIGLALALYYVYPSFYALGGLITIDLKERARAEWLLNREANPDGSKDPPIINTIYLNMSDDKRIGGITILERRETQKATLREIESMSEEERLEVSNFGLPSKDGEQIDLGRTTEREREGILRRTADRAWEFLKDLTTRNFISDMSEWRPNGYIDVVSRLTFYSVFFAFFGVLGTIAATRSLSATFGGDIELAGLTRLI